MFIREWLDRWTWQAKLVGAIVLAGALAAVVAFVIVPLTASPQPPAATAPTSTVATPQHSMTTTATRSAKPSATPTPVNSTTPAGPTAVESLKLIHYHVVSVSGSTTTWAPPSPSQPIVKTTPKTATAFFEGFSCYIPVAGTGLNGATFNIGQLIVFGPSVVKPSEVGRTVTKITFTASDTPIGYAYCVRT